RPDPRLDRRRSPVPRDLPRAPAAVRGQRRGRRRDAGGAARADGPPRRRPDPAPHRLEPGRPDPATPRVRRHRGRRGLLLRPLLRGRAARRRRRGHAGPHRPRASVRLRGRARPDARRPVPPGAVRRRRPATHRQRRRPRGAGAGGGLMLRRRVIPCLDVANGRVVKGTRFVDLVDAGDPPELAERYAAEGADELVFLDITAAPEGGDTLLDIVERTARRAFIPLTVGGGVRSVRDMREVLRAGADKVALNTAAVADPLLVSRCAARFGRQAFVVAIDARRANAAGWEVVVRGGRKSTGLDSV